MKSFCVLKQAAVVYLVLCPLAWTAELPHYYAHDAVKDSDGIIAPWYTEQNGQCDFRVRIAAETLKRYPWTDPSKAAATVPEFVFSGAWSIADDGTISIPAIQDWANGDLGQRAAYIISSLVDYYRYAGDPAAIAMITAMADVLLVYCQTPPEHPWPNFLISVPMKGKPYGRCEPSGMIQLDIVAETGLALLHAYELTANERWLSAAKHWADLLAEKCDCHPGIPPWNRYANPEAAPWGEDQMTGGVAFLLCFFDELIRLDYKGQGDAIVKARDAGRSYLRDSLLPRWTIDDTWGRNYWDWPDPVQAENVTEFVVRYLIEHPDYFPNWRNDARNILSLFLNRTSVAPGSGGDVYSGAWAYPESSGCCGRSLWYGPMELAPLWAQYGAEAESKRAWEIGRRQQILATYDIRETGVVEDNIDGGKIVAGDWFKIAHPMALKHVLGSIAWQPEVFGAARENHIVRSTAVVSHVDYAKGLIRYSTFDAPEKTMDVLRLSFLPAMISAEGNPLPLLQNPDANGYVLKELPAGDCLVTIRHDSARNLAVEGKDPQTEERQITFTGDWKAAGGTHASASQDASAELMFTGNQVRVIGNVNAEGGLAGVYLDDVKQRCPIDCWNPAPRLNQVLYYNNGLKNAPHKLKLMVRGASNPVSKGTGIFVNTIQYSSATGVDTPDNNSGPIETQRILFGFTGREDYVDAQGQAWRPGTEFIVRAAALADSVKGSWWTERRRFDIANTGDPELYRYGVHAPEFWVNATVGSGEYYVCLKFAETRAVEPPLRAVTIFINGEEKAVDLDIAATAQGMYKAVDLTFNGIRPKNGVIEIRFKNNHGGEAMVQAVEVGQGTTSPGEQPVTLPKI